MVLGFLDNHTHTHTHTNWPIRKLNGNVSDVDEFKIELVRKLCEAVVEGDAEISEIQINFAIRPTLNFRKLLKLKHDHDFNSKEERE